MQHVIQLLRMNGFRIPREDPLQRALDLIYHDYDSRRSTPGFPDLNAVHPDRLEVWYIETKTEKGRLTPDQKLWKTVLEAVEKASGGRVRYRLVRPSDLPGLAKEMGGYDPRLIA